MSLDIMKTVWDTSKHRNSRLLAMLCFADHADEDGISWPGYEKLAKRCRLTPNRIGKLVKVLEDSREIYVNHGGGRGKSNRYFIALGRTEKDIATILNKRMKKPKKQAEKIAVWLITGKGERPEVERKSVRHTPVGKRENDGTFANVPELLNDGENALNDGENALQTMVKPPSEPSCEPSLEPPKGATPANGQSRNGKTDFLDPVEHQLTYLPDTGLLIGGTDEDKAQADIVGFLSGYTPKRKQHSLAVITAALVAYLLAVRKVSPDFTPPADKRGDWIRSVMGHLESYPLPTLRKLYSLAVTINISRDNSVARPGSLDKSLDEAAFEQGKKKPRQSTEAKIKPSYAEIEARNGKEVAEIWKMLGDLRDE